MNSVVRSHEDGAITLVDFRLPAKDTEVIQNLVNDEIISTSIIGNSWFRCVACRVVFDHSIRAAAGGSCKKFYICLHKPESASTSQVLNYVSKLYSTVWNAAAMKNIFDIQCSVVSDSMEGIVRREEILQLRNLTRVMTFDPSSAGEINAARKSNNLAEVEFTDVNGTAAELFTEYSKQPSVIVLDSHYEEQPREIPTYNKVALGGTFDNMHYGHCKLLTLAALCCSERLTVGITGDAMLSKKANAEMISNFDFRRDTVESFIRSIKPRLQLNLAELSDPFGPAVTDPELEAIVVSSETIRGAFKINAIRVQRGMNPLAVLVTYRTDSVVLSSTFIREKKQPRPDV
jgi:phosphopantetheine adenylyltransferase